MKEILKDSSNDISVIHCNINPSFGGVNPEPIESNLGELIAKCKKEKVDIGIATDGDGDRIGAVDSEGRFVTSHHIFSLLLLHLIKNKKQTGEVVKTISSTYLIERIAKKYNLIINETPIGFKYICELMMKKDILIGGEESGGIGFKGHIPERDGILSGLYLLEMMAYEKKDLKTLLDELQDEFGESHYLREDLLFDGKRRDELLTRVNKNKTALSPREVKDYDGIKMIFYNDSWLLIRPSGTEPVLRIYAEAESYEKVKELIEYGKNLVKDFLL